MGYYGSQWEKLTFIWYYSFKFTCSLIVSESDKPGFVSKTMIVVINLENLLPNISSDLPKKLCRNSKCVSSIWSCSRWGLPCHFYH